MGGRAHRSGRAVGAEALVRWQHPSRGLLAPGQFIGPAKYTGLIAPLTDWALAQETLETLHRMSVSLSIDDFGTGYTSLASLTKLPVNEIKIDRSFVNGMLANDNDAGDVRSVIEIGHNLGLKIVTEGVGTKETLDRLSTFGCDQAQGFFISQPGRANTCETGSRLRPGNSRRSTDPMRATRFHRRTTVVINGGL